LSKKQPVLKVELEDQRDQKGPWKGANRWNERARHTSSESLYPRIQVWSEQGERVGLQEINRKVPTSFSKKSCGKSRYFLAMTQKKKKNRLSRAENGGGGEKTLGKGQAGSQSRIGVGREKNVKSCGIRSGKTSAMGNQSLPFLVWTNKVRGGDFRGKGEGRGMKRQSGGERMT